MLTAFTSCYRNKDLAKCPNIQNIANTPAIYNALGSEDDWEGSTRLKSSIKQMITTGAVISTCMLFPIAALAVSGGGLDYANLDISNENFSGGNFKGKDFTQGSFISNF